MGSENICIYNAQLHYLNQEIDNRLVINLKNDLRDVYKTLQGYKKNVHFNASVSN